MIFNPWARMAYKKMLVSSRIQNPEAMEGKRAHNRKAIRRNILYVLFCNLIIYSNQN
jgi:hypothetical protein